jgi:hypothetical protein
VGGLEVDSAGWSCVEVEVECWGEVGVGGGGGEMTVIWGSQQGAEGESGCLVKGHIDGRGWVRMGGDG